MKTPGGRPGVLNSEGRVYRTDTVAGFESAVPHGLLTRTQYVSLNCRAGVVNVRDVAPETGN